MVTVAASRAKAEKSRELHLVRRVAAPSSLCQKHDYKPTRLRRTGDSAVPQFRRGQEQSLRADGWPPGKRHRAYTGLNGRIGLGDRGQKQVAVVCPIFM